jgi:prepilin-type processing-associated H-X9-DG protein/prepilin-type N-terminal cleavage/methylation domain-containing protein
MNRTKHGFTLVELLVTIGLIALLIALLMPALNVARQAAKSVQCLSNLRQLALAAHSYAAENRGYYPPAQYSRTGPEGTTYFNWDFTTVIDAATGSSRVVPGLLWGGQTDARVLQCPSYDRSYSVYDPYTGYNYNTSYIGHGENEAIEAPAKVNQVKAPQRCALFGDAEYQYGANKYMRAPLPSPGDATFGYRWAGTQGFRHRGRANVVFADGHGESLKKRFTAGFVLPPNVGFLSEDNSLYGG